MLGEYNVFEYEDRIDDLYDWIFPRMPESPGGRGLRLAHWHTLSALVPTCDRSVDCGGILYRHNANTSWSTSAIFSIMRHLN